MAKLFQGGTALVTGAASGIGRATACAFALHGCQNLFLGDLNLEGLEETKKIILAENEVQVHISRLDIADEAMVASFHDECVKLFGKIDYAANVAGYAHPASECHVLTEKQFDLSYNVNMKGTFLCERAQIQQMLKQPLEGQCRGSIVNVASVCSRGSIPGLSAYSATKGGLLGLSLTDSVDYGPDGIRVNIVAPGNTLTPMVTNAMGPEHLEIYAASTPLRRNAMPKDIANGIVWLSSPMASYITGVQLAIDGGLHLRTGPT